MIYYGRLIKLVRMVNIPLKLKTRPRFPFQKNQQVSLAGQRLLRRGKMGTEKPQNKLRHSCFYAAAFKKLYKYHGRLNLYVSTISGL